MATKGKMIADLQLRFTGGKPSDDFEVDWNQMAFWIDNVNGSLLPKWIMQVNGGVVPPAIIQRKDCKTVNTEKPECMCGCTSYTYLQFDKDSEDHPVVPLTLPDDRGCVLVQIGEKQIFRLPSPTMLSVMTNLHNGATTPYFYRIADKIYLFNGIYPSYTKVTVFGAFSDTSDLTDEDVYPTVDELIPMILDEAEKIGRRELATPKDITDDGK